jgi:hypothetical protein
MRVYRACQVARGGSKLIRESVFRVRSSTAAWLSRRVGSESHARYAGFFGIFPDGIALPAILNSLKEVILVPGLNDIAPVTLRLGAISLYPRAKI